MKSKYSMKLRVRLVQLYLKELERICNGRYEGDWEKMPVDRTLLEGVRWGEIASRVKMDVVVVAQIIRWALQNDAVINRVCDTQRL